MTAITWLNDFLMLLLSLTLLAWVKLRWPESALGKMIVTIV